jgi:hypothetical protein
MIEGFGEGCRGDLSYRRSRDKDIVTVNDCCTWGRATDSEDVTDIGGDRLISAVEHASLEGGRCAPFQGELP